MSIEEGNKGLTDFGKTRKKKKKSSFNQVFKIAVVSTREERQNARSEIRIKLVVEAKTEYKNVTTRAVC